MEISENKNFSKTITPGTLTLSNGDSNRDSGVKKVGKRACVVAGIKLTANSVEGIKIKSITFYQIGSISDGDVSDVELFVDDMIVGRQSALNEGKAKFNFSEAIVVKKGTSINIYLRLNLVGGHGKSINFCIKSVEDIQAVGALYGKNIQVNAGSGAGNNKEIFWAASIISVKKPFSERWWFSYLVGSLLIGLIVVVLGGIILYIILPKANNGDNSGITAGVAEVVEQTFNISEKDFYKKINKI